MTGQSDIPNNVRRTLLPTKEELLAQRQKAIAKKQEEAAVENAVWLDEQQLKISQKIRDAVANCNSPTNLAFPEFRPSLVNYQRELLVDLLKNSDLPHTWTDDGLVIHLNFLPQFDHSTQQCIPAPVDLASHIDKHIPEIATELCDDQKIAELDRIVSESHVSGDSKFDQGVVTDLGSRDTNDQQWMNICISHLKKKFSVLTQKECHVVVSRANEKRMFDLQLFLNSLGLNFKVYRSKRYFYHHILFPVNEHFVACAARLNQHY